MLPGKYCSKPERWYYLEAEESGLQHWPRARLKIPFRRRLLSLFALGGSLASFCLRHTRGR